MPWLITFEDDPGKAHFRATHTDRHLAYVRGIERHILLSGALRETADGRQTGGMWVIDVPDRAEAVALFEGDPFFGLGLRTNVRVLHWTRGVWEGRLG